MKALAAAFFVALLGIARAEPLWVGIAADGQAASSRDGAHWNEAVLKGKFRALAYGDGKFVAVGDRIAMSKDGVTWRDLGSAPARFEGLAYGHSRFVALAGRKLWRSEDGQHFTAGKEETDEHDFGRGLACGDTEAGFCFVGIGVRLDDDNASGWHAASTNGENWNVGLSNASLGARAVVYGAGHFLLVGSAGLIQTAHDSVTWVTQIPPAQENFVHALWSGDRFLIKGEHVWSSPDGEKWTAAERGFDPWGDRFIAIAIGDVP